MDETGNPITHHDGSPATLDAQGRMSEPASGILFDDNTLDGLLDVTDAEIESLLDESDDQPPPAEAPAKEAAKAAKSQPKPNPGAQPPQPGAEPGTVAPPEQQPKYVFGKQTPAYTSAATNDDVRNEVGAIRSRGEARTGAPVPAGDVIATFQRNLLRKVRAAVIAKAVQMFGRVPTKAAVDATMARWQVRWLDKLTEAAQRELRAHNHANHAGDLAHQKHLAQMHIDHVARGQEQRLGLDRRGGTERRSGKRYKVANNRRSGDDRRQADRRGSAESAVSAESPVQKFTVANLTKARIKYKDSKLTEIVHDYLLRSYPEKDVEWALDPNIKWEYEPHQQLSEVNDARRPGGRDPKKVQAIGDSLKQGASMDPLVYVEYDTPPNPDKPIDIADGWHRSLGAKDANWDEVPAFIGRHTPDKYRDLISGAMQDNSDSKKKAAVAELAVLRRFVRKGGLVENFRTAALDPDIMRMLAAEVAKGEREAAFETARGWISKAGNPEALREWFNDGADGQIDWGSPGDFDACVSVAGKYMDNPEGYCNLRHQDAVGGAPGSEDKVEAGPPRGIPVAMLEAAANKDFSLSAPLATGFVPYDLVGQGTSSDVSLQRCKKCGNALIGKEREIGLCGDCQIDTHGALYVGQQQKGDDLLKLIDAELARRGVDLSKYSDDEPRDDRGRWTGGGGDSASPYREGDRVRILTGPHAGRTGSIGRTVDRRGAPSLTGSHHIVALTSEGGTRRANGGLFHHADLAPADEQTRARMEQRAAFAGVRAALQGQAAVRASNFVAHKYSDDEPRDEHGRWSPGGGGTPVDPSTVRSFLNQYYPPEKTAWVEQGKWVRADVPLGHIDFSHRPGNPPEPAKVNAIADRIRGGETMKPVVLVDTGADHLKVGDGYHRALGSQAAGSPTLDAFVGSGLGEHGPWEGEIHDAKLNTGSAWDRAASEARGLGKLDDDPDFLPKYSPDQPRDDHGRFSDGGGGGGPVDTQTRYKGADGYSPERAALHAQIADHLLAGAPVSDTPTVTMTGGGPAAGKSVMLSGGAIEVGGAPTIDVDGIKAMLPEYQQGVREGNTQISSLVHEESSEIAKEIAAKGLADGKSLVYDSTGDNDVDKLAGKIQAFRDAGAKVVNGEYATVHPDTAWARAQARGDATGRYVPETYLRETHASISSVFPQALERGLYDNARLWDTNSGTPKLVVSYSRDSGITVHDPVAWAQFRSYANKAEQPDIAKGEALHGWANVDEGERTKKGDVTVQGGAHSVAGVVRDGKRYGVGVGRDDDGVFVHTHRARSKSYPDMDAIPTSVLAEIDATG